MLQKYHNNANYHSYHPLNVKKNLVREMIKHAYTVTSPEFISGTKDLLIRILRNSSYPVKFINEQLALSMSPPDDSMDNEKVNSDVRYVSCSYYTPLVKRIKAINREVGLKAKLAPRPSSSNKCILLSRVKDVRERSSTKNAIFRVDCLNCDFKFTRTTKGSDISRAMKKLFNEKSSPCNQHLLEFPCHIFNERAVIVKSFHNNYEAASSSYVLRYIGDIKVVTQIILSSFHFCLLRGLFVLLC